MIRTRDAHTKQTAKPDGKTRRPSHRGHREDRGKPLSSLCSLWPQWPLWQVVLPLEICVSFTPLGTRQGSSPTTHMSFMFRGMLRPRNETVAAHTGDRRSVPSVGFSRRTAFFALCGRRDVRRANGPVRATPRPVPGSRAFHPPHRAPRWCVPSRRRGRVAGTTSRRASGASATCMAPAAGPGR